MCYNCGCGNPNDDMGDSANITNNTFEKAATAEKQSVTETKLKTWELLNQELNGKTE